jgi:hypothetical protein
MDSEPTLQAITPTSTDTQKTKIHQENNDTKRAQN